MKNGGGKVHYSGRGSKINKQLEATAVSQEEEVAGEKFAFSADVSRVMEIIINSLYSDRDVFLRELVSNAADACDKKKFLSLTGGDAIDSMRIRITPDKEKKVLIIEDTGIGMSKEELVNTLGKIAMSGTKKFAEALGETKGDVNLIGQFGVGFYSGFLVADTMTVITRTKEDGGTYFWKSDAKSGFEVGQADENEIDGSSGTKIILNLKEECEEYLEDYKLSTLLKKYSEFIDFPIELLQKTTEYEMNEKNETVPVSKNEYNIVNSMKPLWLRNPKECNASEYAQFYRSAFRAFDDPLRYSHFALEGQVQFRALLFVPSILPFELSRNMFDENNRAMKLYVKRVFINDKFTEELLPRWLSFLRGLVDSEDLPLNVGREILQKSKMLSIIKKRLVRKSLDLFFEIQKNQTEYDSFYQNFGKYLKVGIVEEQGDNTQKELAKLIKFYVTEQTETITLTDYVESIKSSQANKNISQLKILYVSGEGRKAAEASPVLERLKKENYQVLLLTEPLDELVVQAIGSFDGLEIADASRDDVLDNLFPDTATDDEEDEDESFDDLKSFITNTLGNDKISTVKISKRLTDSPAALVQGAYGMSPMMQKYMQANAAAINGGTMDPTYGVAKPTMEINPKHPIILKLKKHPDTETAYLLFDLASLTSGYDIQDTAAFAKRVNYLLISSTSPNDSLNKTDDEAKDVEVL